MTITIDVQVSGGKLRKRRSNVDQLISGCASWKEFFQTTSNLPTSAPGALPDKGKVFERLTQLYLRAVPEYETRLRNVWLAKHELPSEVRKRIQLPVGDEGIDLVAETQDGKFWAIQSKFRTDSHKPLTVGALSTFANLSFNVCRNISLAIVVHTCSKPVRKQHLLKHTTEIGLDRWLALEEEGWQRIKSAISRKALVPPARRTPRAHQKAAIDAVTTHFVKGGASRGRLIMPCGTGKSLTAFWATKALKPKTVVIAVPSLALIRQSLTDWTREFLAHGEIPDWLVVCSDDTAGNLEHDEFVGEVYDLGVDATTDPSDIAAFLRRRTAKRKVIFTTYQSGEVFARGVRKARLTLDLGIMDEAHRTVGSQDKSFAHLLFDKNVRIRRRLFMTATERVVPNADSDTLSMDDPEKYGECLYQMSFKQAIDAKPAVISDYRILTLAVASESVKRLIKENRYLKTTRKALGLREAQSLAAGIALQRAFNEEGVRHAISFHRSIRSADAFREQHERIVFRDRGPQRPQCFHISSRKTTGERAELLDQFRQAKSGLITNARCLQEGVDIPAVDCVLFADPKQSTVDIVQAAGRAMRSHPTKRFGYIVVPIVVPTGMPFDEFAETTEFKQVARVITALSTEDERIAEEFRAVTSGKRGRGAIVEIKGQVPVGLKIDFERFREQIRLRLWQRVGRANWRSFEDARGFVRALGLRNQRDWFRYVDEGISGKGKRPPDIPTAPHLTYARRGWQGYGDWLGTGYIREHGWRAFEEARSYVRKLKLQSIAQWRAFCRGDLHQRGRKPRDIPSSPHIVYARSYNRILCMEMS